MPQPFEFFHYPAFRFFVSRLVFNYTVFPLCSQRLTASGKCKNVQSSYKSFSHVFFFFKNPNSSFFQISSLFLRSAAFEGWAFENLRESLGKRVKTFNFRRTRSECTKTFNFHQVLPLRLSSFQFCPFFLRSAAFERQGRKILLNSLKTAVNRSANA
jgi:hypothetical protein